MLYSLLESILLISKPKTYLKLIISSKQNLILSNSIINKFKSKWITYDIDEFYYNNRHYKKHYTTRLNGYLYDKQLIIIYNIITNHIYDIFIIKNYYTNTIKYDHFALNHYSCKFYENSICEINIINKFLITLDLSYYRQLFDQKQFNEYNYSFPISNVLIIDSIIKQKENNWPVLLDVKNKILFKNPDYKS